MKRSMKKVLVLILALCFIFSLVTAGFAADSSDPSTGGIIPDTIEGNDSGGLKYDPPHSNTYSTDYGVLTFTVTDTVYGQVLER